MVWLPVEDEVRIWSPGHKRRAQIKVQFPPLLQPSLQSPSGTFTLCNTASSQRCPDMHSPCGTPRRDTEVPALALKWWWLGACSALPDPTAPLLVKAVVLLCQQQPDVLPQKVVVSFSLCAGGTWGSVLQEELERSCFGEVLGKWHVLCEPIPVPSRGVEFPWGLCVLQHISISSTDILQIGKMLFLKYTFWVIFLYLIYRSAEQNVIWRTWGNCSYCQDF